MGELALGEVREVDVDYLVVAGGGEVGEGCVAGGEDGGVDAGGEVGFVDSDEFLGGGGGHAGGWRGEGGGVG